MDRVGRLVSFGMVCCLLHASRVKMSLLNPQCLVQGLSRGECAYELPLLAVVGGDWGFWEFITLPEVSSHGLKSGQFPGSSFLEHTTAASSVLSPSFFSTPSLEISDWLMVLISWLHVVLCSEPQRSIRCAGPWNKALHFKVIPEVSYEHSPLVLGS